MTITTTKLTRAAGMSAVAAGLLFIIVQFIHPHEDVVEVTTTAWTVTHQLTMLMAVLALIGISGMYLRQVEQTGLLGLVGFVLFGSCFLVITAFTFVEAFVLPLLAAQTPQFVNDVLAVGKGGAVVGDVGGLKAVSLVSAVGYLLGGLLFGIALFRGRILARWAALLLSAGTVVTILVPVIPHSMARMTAVPVGLALAGLGYSLWREQRTPTARPMPSAAAVRHRSPRTSRATAEVESS